MSNVNIFLIVLFVIGLGYLMWVAFNMMQKSYCGKVKEHFTETEEEIVIEDTDSEEYKSRLNVMKVFDTILHRKPTTEELAKYSKISNEQDILVEVLKDYPIPPTPTESESETQEEFVSSETKEETYTISSEISKRSILKKLDNIVYDVEAIKKLLT